MQIPVAAINCYKGIKAGIRELEYSLMSITTINRCKTITVDLSPTSVDQIVTIYQNNGLTVGATFISDYKIVSYNSFLKNLKAFAKIDSLVEAPLPDFALEDSETEKLYKVLDVEWNSPRKQLDLFIKSGNQDWSPVGSVSLLNPSGYPFRIYNLLDVYTDNLAFELGENSKIGVRIKDVGYGLLSGSDKITIHGSYVEEIYLLNNEPPININVNVAGGGYTPTTPDYLIGNTTYLDNSFLLTN